ncbi:MAG: hypothetical protein Q7K39_01760 [Candidatus Magasanikbacteria bacterium]|nr:hypothetical protein [Candidatus Magasanikbacteria bacterium]
MDKFLNFVVNSVPGMDFSYVNLAVIVIGFMGGLALMYAILLEAERRQDAVFVVGAASLFVYALVRQDYVIMFATVGMILVAGRELIQIWRGKHHHTVANTEKYEHNDGKMSPRFN